MPERHTVLCQNGPRDRGSRRIGPDRVVWVRGSESYFPVATRASADDWRCVIFLIAITARRNRRAAAGWRGMHVSTGGARLGRSSFRMESQHPMGDMRSMRISKSMTVAEGVGVGQGPARRSLRSCNLLPNLGRTVASDRAVLRLVVSVANSGGCLRRLGASIGRFVGRPSANRRYSSHCLRYVTFSWSTPALAAQRVASSARDMRTAAVGALSGPSARVDSVFRRVLPPRPTIAQGVWKLVRRVIGS